MKFKIHFSFFVVLLLFLLCGQFSLLLSYVFVLFLHELSHKIVAKHFGYRLDGFVLMAQGAKISSNCSFKNVKEEVLIAFAGPICNFILFFLSVAFWWILPESYALTRDFAFCNLVVGLFNLLPIFPLDGGQITQALFLKFGKEKLGKKICKIFAILLSLMFFGLFVFSIFVCPNFSFLLMSIFVFTSIFESEKSGIYKQIELDYQNFQNKKQKSKVQNFVVYTSDSLAVLFKKLSKNSFNVAYVVNKQNGEVVASLFEGEIFYILKNNPLSRKIEEVV